jgi:very-short-patch-repair endonuclease
MTPAEKYLWRTLNELMPCQWSFGVSAVPFTLDFFHWRSDLVVEILSPHRPAESTSREHRQIVLEAKYGLVIKIIDEDTLRDNPQSVLQSIISMVR